MFDARPDEEYEPRNPMSFHRRDDVFPAGRQYVVGLSLGVAERAQNGVGSLDRSLDRVGIEHVPLDDGYPVVVELGLFDLRSASSERAYLVARFERLAHQVSARPAGRAEHCQFHVSTTLLPVVIYYRPPDRGTDRCPEPASPRRADLCGRRSAADTIPAVSPAASGRPSNGVVRCTQHDFSYGDRTAGRR